MHSDNIAMLRDTLEILERGSYQLCGETIPLKLSRAQMEEVEVFLPQDVRRVCGAKDFGHVHVPGRCRYGCENADSFTLARKRAEQYAYELKDGKPILVLEQNSHYNDPEWAAKYIYMHRPARERSMVFGQPSQNLSGKILTELRAESAGKKDGLR